MDWSPAKQSVDRRDFLKGAAALTVAASVSAAEAEQPAAKPGKTNSDRRRLL